MNQRILNNLKKQKAVYWGTPVRDGFGGFTYAAPVELKVTWLHKQEKFISALNGEEVLSRAIVLVPQELAIQGMLSLMALANLSSSETPGDNNAYEIKAAGAVPDFKGTNFSRKVWL